MRTLRATMVWVVVALPIALASAFQVCAQDKPKIDVVPQIGHSSLITAVAFSPDGKHLLSGSEDKTIRLWDAATGTLLRTFVGHPGEDAPGASHSVYGLAFSPDGRTFLSAGSDNVVKIRDVVTGRLLRSFKSRSETVRSVAFSKDGRLALIGSYDPLDLWDVTTGKLVRTFDVVLSTNNAATAISSDGRLVLWGGKDGRLELRDTATGALLRSFELYVYDYSSIAFSPDGSRAAASSSNSKSLRLWDVATGQHLRYFPDGSAGVVTFSPNGAHLLTAGSDNTLKLWDAATGALLRTFEGSTGPVAFSPDGTRIASVPGGDHALTIRDSGFVKLWDAASGALLRTFKNRLAEVDRVALSPDGSRILAGGMMWDATSGALVRSIQAHEFSPDGKYLLSIREDLKLWDAATGALLRVLPGGSEGISGAFSADGKRLTSTSGRTLKQWDVATGRELRSLQTQVDVDGSVYSPDGKHALALSRDGVMKLWSLANGRVVRSFDTGVRAWPVVFSPDGSRVALGAKYGEVMLWDLSTGRRLRTLKGHNSWVTLAFSPDGTRVLSGGNDGTMKLWDVATGRLLRSFARQSDANSITYAKHGRWVVSGDGDGAVRMWNAATGQLLVSMLATADGEWLAITPEGFFNASSPKAAPLLGIVSGLDAYGVDQMWQSLYAPDLVREKLAGDPKEEVVKAAAAINLDKVLDSGKAPGVVILSPSPNSKSADEIILAEAKITAQGDGGIGRVEWRVNGITVGVTSPPPGSSGALTVTKTVALDPGESTIEVVAYNGRNLLASVPARTKVTWTGTTGAKRPNLHVLAIGINHYIDQGGVAPGETETKRFRPLGLAVPDAKGFAEKLKRAGQGLYGDVRVRTVLDEQATSANLDTAVSQMATEIEPRDTFVLYAAAHGYSHHGRFYLIPQDYQGGPDPQALAARAIDQLKLQDWIANTIRAKKAVILFDTCESGALTAGYSRSRFDGSESDAAIGRLHEATGRPVLTAAALGQAALELTELGHGVFTSALIDSFYRGDANRDGMVSVSELVSHVQDLVPRLIKDPKARAEVIRRGPVGGVQSARFGGRGEDFAFVHRLQ